MSSTRGEDPGPAGDESAALPAQPAASPAGDETAALPPGAAGSPVATAQTVTVPAHDYVVGGELGRGGMGRVLAAEDTAFGRPVAVKELLVADPALRRRFERETRITARLQHPSVVPVYAAGDLGGGRPFYAMKRVAGRSLDRAIDDAGGPDARMALLPSVLAVAEAIAYAHSRRVVHRDIKPANVLVGEFGETVVIDWGLAKDLADVADPADDAAGAPYRAAGDATAAGRVMGTPAYMPPEQARGEPVDERADVYALGALLYHVLAGAPPYRRPDEQSAGWDEVRARVIHGPPTPLAERVADLPDDLLAIVAKAMARDPAERYPSARELAEDLRRFQTGQLVGAHQYSLDQLLRRWLRRHRAEVAVGVVSLILLAGLGVAGLRRIVAEKNAKERQRSEAVRQRDRAGRAQQTAVGRLDQFLLARARDSLRDDPTATVAGLGEVSGDEAWHAARMLVSDARDRGVARRVLAGHEGAVGALAFTPDGKRVLSGGADGTVRVWDVAGGGRRILGRMPGGVDEVVVSPSGRQVAAAGEDQVRVWDLDGGGERTHAGYMRGQSRRRCISFSPDGNRLAFCGGRFVRVWDLGGQEARTFDAWTGTVNQVAFSPDGAQLLTPLSDGNVVVWPVAGGGKRVVAKLPAEATAAAFSGDGRFVTAGDSNGNLRRWALPDFRTVVFLGERHGVVVVLMPGPGGVAAGLGDGTLWVENGATDRVGDSDHLLDLAVSKDGAVAAAALADGTALLASSGHERRLRGHRGMVLAVAVSPGGETMASAGMDGAIRLWGTGWQPTGTELPLAPGEPRQVVFSPRGDDIAVALRTVAEDSTVTSRVDLSSASHGRSWPGAVAAGFAADGTLVLALEPTGCPELDGLAARVAVATGDQVVTCRGESPFHRGDAPDTKEPICVGTVAVGDAQSGLNDEPAVVAADLGLVVEGSSDGVLICRLADGRVSYWPDTNLSQTHPVAISPDGRTIAAGGADGVVRVRAVDGGEVRELRGHERDVYRVAFSPDGALLASAGRDGTVRLWTLADGTSRVLTGHAGPVSYVAFSPDGRLLASTGHDTSIRVWPVAGGEPRVLRGHEAEVRHIAFSPDGTELASAGVDRTVRLWDVATGDSRVLGRLDNQVRLVAFSPDGATVASADQYQQAWLWPDDLPRGREALRRWMAAATDAKLDGEGRPRSP